MRVVCDNCGASYKIPEKKLVRDVNKATCRKCGHKIIIRRPSRDGAPIERTDDESTHITERGSSHDEVQATEMRSTHADPREATVPRDDLRAAASVSALLTPDTPTIPPPPAQTAPVQAVPVQAVPVQAVPVQAVPVQAAPPQPPAPVTAQPAAFGQGGAPFPPPQPQGYGQPVPQQPYPQAAPPQQPYPQAPAYPQVAPQQPYPQAPPQAYPQVHDPSGDLSLVMMASFFAAIGAVMMAVGGGQQLELLGLGLVLWASFTSLLVLVTGDRGRREAKAFLSMVGALVLAVGVTFGFVTIGAGAPPAETPIAAPEPEKATPEATTPEAGEGVAEAEAGEGDGVAEAEEAEAGEAEAEEPASGDAAATSSGSASSSGGSSSGSSPRSSGSSSSGASPRSSGSSSGSASSGSASSGSASSGSASSGSASSGSSSEGSSSSTPKATSVPPTVIDTMVKTNRGVKVCFKEYRDETGSLPSGRIPMKITILPSGKVSGAYIDGGAYAGSSLDSCLSKAIRSITFPPFDGEARTYPYLFQF